MTTPPSHPFKRSQVDMGLQPTSQLAPITKISVCASCLSTPVVPALTRFSADSMAWASSSWMAKVTSSEHQAL